jgi:hypothetical protein
VVVVLWVVVPQAVAVLRPVLLQQVTVPQHPLQRMLRSLQSQRLNNLR